MTTNRAVSLVLAAACGALLAFAPIASASKNPVIFGVGGEALYKPKTIFLSANSGPQLEKLKWERWGTNKAVGRGIYVSDCASCPPPRTRKATVFLKNARRCASQPGRTVYTKGHLKVKSDSSPNKTVVTDLPTGFIRCSDTGGLAG